jgi:hypothetical protein
MTWRALQEDLEDVSREGCRNGTGEVTTPYGAQRWLSTECLYCLPAVRRADEMAPADLDVGGSASQRQAHEVGEP